MNKIKLGRYRHFKGHLVQVLFIAKHSETLEELVVYIELTENKEGQIWVRPKKMFLEKVERDGKKVPRFEFLG